MATMMKEERNERREIYSFRRIIKKRKDEPNIYIDQSINRKEIFNRPISKRFVSFK